LTNPGSDRPAGAGARAVDDLAVTRAAGALWRSGDFGVVVLGTRRTDPVTLAGSGVAIWDALAQPRTRDELADLLAVEFATDRDLVAADIGPVLDDLVAGGALEVAS
jgi:hypothetical protein